MINQDADKYKNIHRIFHPQSIAVLGANKVKGTVPSDILTNILKAEYKVLSVFVLIVAILMGVSGMTEDTQTQQIPMPPPAQNVMNIVDRQQ